LSVISLAHHCRPMRTLLRVELYMNGYDGGFTYGVGDRENGKQAVFH
jgi:hypothetical protein